MKHWDLQTVPWHLFDASKVNPRLLAQAKGAALVEANAADYVAYLRQVFAGDAVLIQDIELWGEEEKLHGAALRRWAEMADPSFDYEASMKRFQDAFRLPLEAQVSVRGSRARELISRCVVETGTVTFYSAMRDAVDEPVLKEICRRIAGDEVRHFNLFLKHLNENYAAQEELGLLARLKTILGRILEVDDQELTFAYFAANAGDAFNPAKLSEYSKTYMAETVPLYHSKHFQASVPFLGKAAGLAIRPWMSASLGRVFHRAFRHKYL